MIRIDLVRIRARMALIRLMSDGTEVVGMGSGTYGRMAAALKNSVVRFQRDEDDPDVKAGTNCSEETYPSSRGRTTSSWMK